MREIYKVNISELNQFLETIRTAKNNLNNNSYDNFKKSYLYISNNPKIVEIKNNLNKKYEKIIADYNTIIKWLSEYIDDVEKLEKTLSTGTNFINDVETRNYVNKILADSSVSIPRAHSGKILRMKIVKYGEDIYNHIISSNNDEKGKQINRTATYTKVSGLSNVPTYSRDWREKKTSSTANNMLNNLNNISVLQYMPKEEKKDPELQKIMDQYGEETAVNYMLYTSFEDRSNELSKIITEKEKELKDAKEELYYINMEVGYGYDGNSGKIIPLQEKIASLEKEIEENIEPLKEELAETNFYLKEAKKNLEISKFASVLTSDKIAWEEDGYSRTFAEEYQNYLKIMKDEKKPDICKYMTEEQANIYCFYYHYMNREHPDLIGTSDDFIKIIEDDINKAKGAEAAAKWIENYEKYKANPNDTISFKNLKGFITQGSLTVGKGFFDGLDSFFDGVKNAFDWNGEITTEDYEKMIIAQYIIEEGIYDDAYKISSSFGNMLPSIVTSTIVSAIATPAAGAEVAAKLAPIVGSTLMGVSSGGNALHEALVNGHSTGSALMYGIFTGGSEGIVGYFLGKMPFLSKGKDAVSMTMKQTAKEYIKDLLSEGLEELTQEVFDAVFRNICLGEEIDFDSLPTDMRDSFCMGVLMSYALSGGPYKTARFVIDGIEYNIKLSDLADQLYTNGHLNKNLTKADIKNIIKNGGTASVAQISDMMNEYNSLMSTISKNEYDIFKLNNNSNVSILYNNDNYVKFKRIAELETAFKEAGVNYNYNFQANTTTNTNTNTNNVVEMPTTNNQNNIVDGFNGFINNNAGAVNIDAIVEIPRNIVNNGKKLFGKLLNDNGGFLDLSFTKKRKLSKQYDNDMSKIFNKLKNKGYSDQSAINIINSLSKDNVIELLLDLDNNSDYSSLYTEITKQYVNLKHTDITKVVNTIQSWGFSIDETIQILNNSSDTDVANMYASVLLYNGIVDKKTIVQNLINTKNITPIKALLGKCGYGEFEISAIIDNIENDSYSSLIFKSIMNNSKFEIFPEYHTGLSIEQYRSRNQEAGYTVNSMFSSVSFNESSGKRNGYGVDQGILDSLFVFYDERDVIKNPDGSVSLKPNARYYDSKYVSQLEKEGKLGTLPPVRKVAKPEYFEMKNKLMAKGFSANDASAILKGIDSTGACSYANVANQIVSKYMNKPNEFKSIFGFDLFKYDPNGKIVNINSSELLLDIYLYINDVKNGGQLFSGSTILKHNGTDIYGRQSLDSDSQAYLSGAFGMNDSIIDNYLKSKDPNLSYFSHNIVQSNSSRISVEQYNRILSQAHAEFISGNEISLGIYRNDVEIRMINLDDNTYKTTYTWNEGGGHAVYVTEITQDGFIVSSWGKKYLIPHEDLINGGRFTLRSSAITN